MPALFVFLLKVNIALLLFCAGYYLILRPLTFYTLNRVYLLVAIVFASIYPLIDFSAFVQRHEALAKPVQHVAFNWQSVPVQNLVKPLSQPDYWRWAEMVFWVGALLLAIRFAVQLFSLFRLYKGSQPATINNHKVRVMNKDAAPFSFWQSIFVNPANHEPADLKAILLHEQVHVNDWHTADILLAEFSSIFYWFNPGIWLMKKAIRENIEFITDQKILNKGMDSKAYQYSLVSVSFSNTQPSIVNHFNISTIKKRIIMMNAKRSSKLNLTRYAFLVPAVIGMLLIFSVSKADFVKKSKVYKSLAIISDNVSKAVGVTKILTEVKAGIVPRKVIKNITITGKDLPAAKSIPAKLKIDTISKVTVTDNALSIPFMFVSKDSTVVYVNGKKNDAKNIKPTNISDVYILNSDEAEPFIHEKLADNVRAAIIITKDSPEGKVLKEKLDNRPLAFAQLRTIKGHPLKGSLNQIVVTGRPMTTTSATYLYKTDSAVAISGLKGRVTGVTTIKRSNLQAIVVDGRRSPIAKVNGQGSNFIYITRDSLQTDPTVYINGKASTRDEFKNLDPDMIESVSVKKDSTANKVGKRKGSGSIYIITKKQ
ncbi:Signal transducer regulating beta-lactamase production, contains metallopeptidase domain [Mucilaginibacter pineti]|uniref:Signal transducer regulating beta-lactamase production, contains metallopeptidase domain n=1 Tax=Mucilaginibacter pineti TaxID=1391627 RepID=A0A1G6XT92_9SPHI|nr:M56 family metallopeptidase [Mucilaginibacter pineti]SDD81360.1 Signal transducer regulating beta-lactamase production, contains metallopeptidase domain [Mucilaginibacter pineti]